MKKTLKNKRSKRKLRSCENEEMQESTNVKSLLSKFVTDIFEKNYSKANSTLSEIIAEKLEKRVKKATANKQLKRKRSCNCDGYEK